MNKINVKLLTPIKSIKHFALTLFVISIFLIQIFSINSLIAFQVVNSATQNKKVVSGSDSSSVNAYPPQDNRLNSSSVTTPSHNIIQTSSPSLKTSSTSSLQSTSNSIPNSYSETVRVDYSNYVTPSTTTWQIGYQYDNLYPQYTEPDVISQGTTVGCLSSAYFGNPWWYVYSQDGNYLFPLTSVGGSSACAITADFFMQFDVTGFPLSSSGTIAGTLYANQIASYSSHGASGTGSFAWVVPTAVATMQTNALSVYSSFTNYITVNPYVNVVGSHQYLEPFFFLTTPATVGYYDRIYVDQVYFTPSLITAYPIDSVTNFNNGTIGYSLNVSPIASTSTFGITIHIPSGLTFQSASNPYTSATPTTGNMVIKGLPAGVTTTLYFTGSAQTTSQTAYPLATSSYTSNGHFVNQVTITPDGPSTIVYIPSDWIFSSSSNSYSSLTAQNGFITISGLPIDQDSILSFTTDNSANAYPLYLNTTITPSNEGSTPTFEINGFNT